MAALSAGNCARMSYTYCSPNTERHASADAEVNIPENAPPPRVGLRGVQNMGQEI